MQPATAPAPVERMPPGRRVPWRGVALGVVSAAALVAVAFAPKLRGLLAAAPTQIDGSAVPSTGFDRWLNENGGGEGYLI